jgi:hypothetical protein
VFSRKNFRGVEEKILRATRRVSALPSLSLCLSARNSRLRDNTNDTNDTNDDREREKERERRGECASLCKSSFWGKKSSAREDQKKKKKKKETLNK